MKNFLQNCGLVLCSLLLLVFFSEFVLFKFIFKPSDYPKLDPSGAVLKFQPDQTGTYRIKEVLQYRPDIVVFNLVHNDFDESYEDVPGVYTNSFMKLRIAEEEVKRVAPSPFVTKWYSPIRNSNIWRFLAVREQVRFSLLRKIILSKPQSKAKPVYQANIDVSGLDTRLSKDEMATRYVFREAKDVCKANNAEFVIMLDGVRRTVYNNPDGPFDYTKGALKLNAMVDRVADKLGIEFIDLQPRFAENYRNNGARFEFENDSHWNELGHTVAAEALYNFLKSDNFNEFKGHLAN